MYLQNKHSEALFRSVRVEGKMHKVSIIFLHIRWVSPDIMFRTHWSICRAIHFCNIDLWIIHVVVFLCKFIPSWVKKLALPTPAIFLKKIFW